MSTYYVDVDSPGAWNGRTGLDSTTNLLLGWLGLQYAVDTAVADDTVLIRGMSDQNTNPVYSVPYDNGSGLPFTAGEAVTWHDGAGVIYEGLAATPCRIELTSGNAPSNNDTITGSTSGATCDVNGTATVSYTLDFDTNAGTYNGGYISYIGVPASSWTPDGTLAGINCRALGSSKHGFNGNKGNLWFENLEIIDATSQGIAGSISQSVYINCHSHDNTSYGFAGSTNCIFIRCSSYANGNHGWYWANVPMVAFFCIAAANAGDGFFCSSYGVYIGCLSYDNTGANSDGFGSMGTNQIAFNCVADNNGGEGFEFSTLTGAGQTTVIGCRSTNNANYGLDANSRTGLYGWMYMPGAGEDRVNTNGTLANNTYLKAISQTSDTNTLAGTDTDAGYNDPTTDDYNLVSTATLRRTAVTLPIETS